MAQTGDPKGTGEGGSSLPNLKAEFNDLPHVRGAVSMARATGTDSANSQFFIMFLPTAAARRHTYTVFGRVQSGMTYVDAVTRGDPESGAVAAASRSTIARAWIEADGPNAPRVPLPVALAARALDHRRPRRLRHRRHQRPLTPARATRRLSPTRPRHPSTERMRVDAFDFALPEDRCIALRPVAPARCRAVAGHGRWRWSPRPHRPRPAAVCCARATAWCSTTRASSRRSSTGGAATADDRRDAAQARGARATWRAFLKNARRVRDGDRRRLRCRGGGGRDRL